MTRTRTRLDRLEGALDRRQPSGGHMLIFPATDGTFADAWLLAQDGRYTLEEAEARDWLNTYPKTTVTVLGEPGENATLRAQWLRSTLKTGDPVRLVAAAGEPAMRIVKCHTKSVRLDNSQVLWTYNDILPLRQDGSDYTTTELVTMMKAWLDQHGLSL